MINLQQRSNRLSNFIPFFKAALVLAAVLALLGWWLKAPPGLLGKMDAAAYAVCHRIAARSFHIGDRQTPLCARCTGMYLGALLGLLYQLRSGKRAGMPPLKISIVLGVFLAAFAIDGGNSYLHFIPYAPSLYEPQNWLRLLTGTGIGLGIAAILIPVIHQTFWNTYDGRSGLSGWRQFLPLAVAAAVLDIAVLSGNPLLLYPLAVLSGASIFLILTMVYAVAWIMLTKRENRFTSYRQMWVPLLAGFLTALVQIAVIDAGRFWMTGTWGGFNL